MRYSYGIMDRRNILLYKPQLFLKSKDLLVFPSIDFQKWYSDVMECLDGLYQIDCIEMEKGKSINITELNLATAVLNNITEELEHLFDSEKVSDSPYHYISALDKEFMKQKISCTSDIERCNMRIPVINEEMKYKHLMEIVEEANRDFSRICKENRTLRFNKKEKKNH